MILFDLKCHLDHVFEAWFNSSAAFDDQHGHGSIECPVCGSNDVEKAVMAPNLSKKAKQKTKPRKPSEFEPESLGYATLPPDLQDELETVLEKVRGHVEENCEYVGESFTEEARRMHYGEKPTRGIYGEASFEESVELMEEGIEVFPLPGIKKPRTDA
ncbi:MAG: DUF1178 family protein [Sphingomonadales bacterium]